MSTHISQLKPKYIPHPGEFVLDQIEARGWSQKDLADILSVSVQTINKIVKGKSGITGDMAAALGAAFDQSPEFWLNLDARYNSFKFADRISSVLEKRKMYERQTAQHH